MSRKKALGRGLEALLGGDGLLEGNEADSIVAKGAVNSNVLENVRKVPVDKISPNPNQPRTHFNDETLEELAESIRRQGIIQPIIVEKTGEDTYRLIAGERRWRASRMAGLDNVPVLVKNFSEIEKIGITLVENIQRENLTPMEEARAYQYAMQSLSLSQQEMSERVGKKRSTVANSLRLLKLPVNIQDAIDRGGISAGHARALLSVDDAEKRRKLFEIILGEMLSVREAERRAQAFNNDVGQAEGGRAGGDTGLAETGEKLVSRDVEMTNLERRFIDVLGTKVFLRGNLDRGKIEISWFNKEDLNRLYDLIVGLED